MVVFALARLPLGEVGDPSEYLAEIGEPTHQVVLCGRRRYDQTIEVPHQYAR